MSVMKAIERMISAAKGSFFLFGPRGTGKSVWLRQRFPEALTISLLDVTRRREMLADPQRLRSLVEGAGRVKDVVIDEIQRAPELLDVVHALMDEKRGYRFILTGSSASSSATPRPTCWADAPSCATAIRSWPLNSARRSRWRAHFKSG